MQVIQRILGGSAVALMALFCQAAPTALAQPAAQATTDTPEKIAERRAEQALPRKAAPFDRAQFDKYVGYYELWPGAVFTIHRDGSRFLARLTGQQDEDVFPEGESKFFYTVVPAQISFNKDASGKVTGLVLHQNGLEQTAPRIDEAAAKRIEADLQARISNKSPSPGTEAALRFSLQSLESRKPDLSNMTPGLAAATTPQLPAMLATIRSLGPMRSLTLSAVSPEGIDIYEVQFAHGAMEWRIAPLDGDGKITSLNGRREYPLKHLVDVGGGRHLNMVCIGKGPPTVVFLQGLGGNIVNWREVREPVAAFARTCFYDRAGIGYSDSSDKPSTAENVADDLHALLHAARIKGRVVLVGQSLGGLFATLYADKYLSDLAGMVLVDPAFSGQFDYVTSQQDKAIMLRSGDEWVASMRICKKLAQDGKLSDSDPHGCVPPSYDLTPMEAKYLTQQFYRPSFYASFISEFENFNPPNGAHVDGDQERQRKRSFGDLPLEVLTAGLFSQDMTISEAGKAAAQDVWKRGHDKLAQRSARGESIVLPNAHHFIQLDQPDRVVEAIRKVVSESRQ